MKIINQIIEKRKQSITFIQECFRQFLLRKKLVSFAKKHTQYYSIYPSREDFKKISIKLYTNLKDPSKFVELPVRFCNKRNCYIFDIPKAKFPMKKKFMCFTFVLDDSTIVDSNYNCIFFGGKYVNQIDFNIIDKKEFKLQKNFKNYMYLYRKILFKNENNKVNKKIDISISNKNEIMNSPIRNSRNNITLSINKSFSGENKILKSYKKSKSTFYSLNNSNEPISLNTSINEERKKSKKKKRNKSILKEHKKFEIKHSSSSKSLDFKKVSFGWVQTSE